MKELEITLERLESTLVLHAVGPVDSITAPRLQEPLLRALRPHWSRRARSGGSPVHEQRRLAYLLLAAKALQNAVNACDS